MERQFAATAAKDLELTSAAVELQLAKLTAKLREDIGEDDFREVVRKQKEAPIAGVRYSHDYCDANMTMDAAWDHAKTRMEAMTL